MKRISNLSLKRDLSNLHRIMISFNDYLIENNGVGLGAEELAAIQVLQRSPVLRNDKVLMAMLQKYLVPGNVSGAGPIPDWIQTNLRNNKVGI